MSIERSPEGAQHARLCGPRRRWRRRAPILGVVGAVWLVAAGLPVRATEPTPDRLPGMPAVEQAVADAQAGRAAGDPGEDWRSLMRRAEQAIERGMLAQADIELARAREQAEAEGNGLRWAAVRVLGARAERTAGRPAAARASLLRVDAPSLPPALRAVVQHELGLCARDVGNVAQASDSFALAAALAESASRSDYALAAQAESVALDARRDDVDVFLERAAQLEARFGAQPSGAAAWLVLSRAGLDLARRTNPASGGEAARAVSARAAMRAAQQAEEAHDLARVAAAHVLLSDLAREAGDAEASLDRARAARSAAGRAGDPDLMIEADVALGRGLRDDGERDAAIATLRRAVASLADRRLATQGLHHARSAAAPPRSGEGVRLELVDLLLQRAAAAGPVEPVQPDLQLALATLEQAKVNELRDYFRDDCVDAWSDKLERPDLISPTAAIVYPIPLPDRMEILVLHSGRIARFSSDVGARAVDEAAHSLRRHVVNRTRRLYRAPARQLYGWMIAPLEEHLEEIGVDTLVFVPGGALRTIPLAVLMNDDEFLISRYAVATIPALELTDPRPIDRADMQVFLGGISKARGGFSELAGVPSELAAVSEMHGAEPLLDEAFEEAEVQQALQKNAFNVVHFATHAQFGGGPEDSFLLAWDGPIPMDALADAIGAFRFRDRPLDLLLLSACETAAGDDRAALGLAGVAVRAGARSALATLWSVGDESSQRVVVEFYRGLSEPGVSRAEALRRAQRALLADPVRGHPAYWGPFLLISGWM